MKSSDTHCLADGVPWCRFEAGSAQCVNDPCHNKHHRGPKPPVLLPEDYPEIAERAVEDD